MLGSKCKAQNVSFYRSLNTKERQEYNRDSAAFMKKFLEKDLDEDGKKILGLQRKVKRLQNKILKKDEEIKRLRKKINKKMGD